MRIGIISDTHDDLRNLRAALEILRLEDITTVFHCGDLSGPAVVAALSEFDVWIARGNVDNHPEMEEAVSDVLGKGRMAESHHLTVDGRAALLIHGHREAELRRLIRAGEYFYVIHGHSHRRRDETIGRTRVINPGALGGMRWQRRSFCILDAVTDSVRFVEV